MDIHVYKINYGNYVDAGFLECSLKNRLSTLNNERNIIHHNAKEKYYLLAISKRKFPEKDIYIGGNSFEYYKITHTEYCYALKTLNKNFAYVCQYHTSETLYLYYRRNQKKAFMYIHDIIELPYYFHTEALEQKIESSPELPRVHATIAHKKYNKFIEYFHLLNKHLPRLPLITHMEKEDDFLCMTFEFDRIAEILLFCIHACRGVFLNLYVQFP